MKTNKPKFRLVPTERDDIPEVKPWVVCDMRDDDGLLLSVHIVPDLDVMEHKLDEMCPCLFTSIELMVNSDRYMYVHKPYDGRTN